MKSTIYIRAKALKELLALFDKEGELTKVELGDTWHPDSGFVDEEILKGKRKVRELLDFAYDFRGLVQFEANLGAIRIEMVDNGGEGEEYRMEGTTREIEMIRNQVIEANAQQPGTYEMQCQIRYPRNKKTNRNRE